jgi:hypothetical protein
MRGLFHFPEDIRTPFPPESPIHVGREKNRRAVTLEKRGRGEAISISLDAIAGADWSVVLFADCLA